MKINTLLTESKLATVSAAIVFCIMAFSLTAVFLSLFDQSRILFLN